MAQGYNIPVLEITRIAAGDISTKQYYVFKQAASQALGICDTQGELALGVLQNKPNASGETARVMILGVTKVVSHDTNIVAGSKLTVDTSGRVEVAASADEVIGIALEAASAEGDIISMYVCHMGVL